MRAFQTKESNTALQIQRAQRPQSSAKVDLGDNHVAQTVCGNHNENLKLIERRLAVRVGMRGTELLLSGAPEQLAIAVRLLESLADIARARRHVYADDVEQAIRIVGNGNGEETVKDVFLGPVLTRGGGRQ